jgi:hypothetical protein
MTTKTKIIIGISSAVAITIVIAFIMNKKAKAKKRFPQVIPLTAQEVLNAIWAVEDPEYVVFNFSKEYVLLSLKAMKQEDLRYINEVTKVIASGKTLSSNEQKKLIDLTSKYGIS